MPANGNRFHRSRLHRFVPHHKAPAYGYVNDAIGRRTSMSRSGSAYSNPDTISYTYNDRSELTGAQSNVDSTYSYSYAYDPIGNRITANEAGVPWTYTTNSLNQYTAATENNDNLSFSYDLDGSMTYRPVDATGGWTQIWNGENRMVETCKGTDRLTFRYDYMGRRVEKCVYSGNTLASRTLFVYDGFKCVEELDALNSNAVAMRHTWQPFDVGLDVILATTDGNGTSYCLHDASKNVKQAVGANGLLLSLFIYSPFGRNKSVNIAYIGYSSELYLQEIGVIAYCYRSIDDITQRWWSREPIGEILTFNLYSFVDNKATLVHDYLGLFSERKDVIIDIIENINPKSRKKNREYCGYICYNCEKKDYIYTSTIGRRGKCIPDAAPCTSPGYSPVAGWHTHGNHDNNYYSEQLSDADLKWIDLHFMRYYLITPSDRVLFVEWQNYPIRKKRLGEWQKWNKNHPIIDSSLKPHFNTYD